MISLLAILATASFVLSTFTVSHVFASPFRIWLDPSTNSYTADAVYIGFRFNVTVWVENCPDPGAAAWAVYMEFDDSVLRVTRWFVSKTDPQWLFYGKTTSENPTPPDPGYVHLSPSKGRILFASNLFPTPPAQTPVKGTGKLAIIEFNITMLPPPGGSLGSALRFGSADTYLLDPDGGNLGSPILEDGHYEISSPATLSIAVGFGGTTDPAPGYHSYIIGKEVIVQSIPFVGYVFDHWELNGTNMGNATSITIIMNTNYTLLATFQAGFILNIVVTVGGTTNPAPGFHTYAEGEETTVQAFPSSGCEFDHWELDGGTMGNTTSITIMMSMNHTLHALFVHPRIYLDPSNSVLYSNTTIVGSRFNVTFWVENVQGLASWEVHMEFDDSIINATRWFLPITDPLYIFAGKAANFGSLGLGYMHLAPFKGIIRLSAWLLPTPPAQEPSSGSGKLCVVEFVVTQTPTSGELSCQLHMNTADTYLLDSDGNILPATTAEDGIYRLVFAARVGDVNDDGKVDVKDVYLVARAFGTRPRDSKWDPRCDLTSDGKVDVRDYYIVCRNYGKTYF